MSFMDELADASFRLLAREPFFGHVFTGMIREPSESLPSMGLALANSQTVRLLVNPSWWQKPSLTEAQRLGAIKHQLLHMVLKHCIREHEFLHRDLFWVAADLVVNQYIAAESLLPEAITLRLFPWMPLGEEVGFYYRALLELLTKTPCESESQETSQSRETLRRLLKEEHSHLEEHGRWQDFTEQPQAARGVAEQFIDEAVVRSSKRIRGQQFDDLPESLQIYLKKLLQSLEPQFDWRRVLRLFAESSRRTWLKNTLRRPSKRYGTTPGIQIRNKQRLMVAIDTSGSIVEEELRLFFSELYHIWRRGAEIMVVECDCVIHKTWRYCGVPPEKINGGGGTSFDPPLKWANEVYHPDAVLYFTDGYAPAPSFPSRQALLWVITPGGVTPESEEWRALPQRKLRLQEKVL
jgi:predicted metal-dependent peptidase